ncbi:hypothetical protein D3C80_1572530 [compost metagenome]
MNKVRRVLVLLTLVASKSLQDGKRGNVSKTNLVNRNTAATEYLGSDSLLSIPVMYDSSMLNCERRYLLIANADRSTRLVSTCVPE